MMHNDLEALTKLDRSDCVSLADSLAETLQDIIISGALASGSKLNEHALAQKLEVSRGALREAVRMLERSGMVVIVPNRGAFVREVSVKDALDIFDVRVGMAGVAGRLGAVRASDKQINELFALHEAMCSACEKKDLSGYFDLNNRFHFLIFETASNPRLSDLDQRLSIELHLFRRRNLGNAVMLKASMREHEAIVEAFSARDPLAVAEAFQRHIQSGRERMLEQLPDTIATH
jgi:DNA-binding GntR family transcriptional regulator